MANNSTSKEEFREGAAELRSAREQFKAAGAAVAEDMRERAQTAAELLRARASQAAANAKAWAGDQFSDLQDEIELRPHRAALFALGIGVVAGILLGALLRPERRA